jgi:GMP reductase
MLTKFKLVEIIENKTEEYSGYTYDLEVENDHSYTANNIIVHNSVCTTRKMTGVGYPQLSAIIECADAAHGLNGYICGDGGITNSGDVAKAFGGGADFIMCGGLFAGHYECEGEIIAAPRKLKSTVEVYEEFSNTEINSKNYRFKVINSENNVVTFDFIVNNDITDPYPKPITINDVNLPNDFYDFTFDENSKMKFYGMSSEEAMTKYYNGKAQYRASEGKVVYVPYKGLVNNTIIEILGGLRSTCTYIGAKSLKQLSKCTTFIRVSQQLNEVFSKHETK